MSLSPYLDAIRAWNPSLDITSYRVDPYGLNNLVIIVNDAWVFRFPRNPESAEGLRREAAVLDLARRHVQAPLPDFQVDEATGFVAYRLLPGRPLYRHLLLCLNVYAQDRFATGLGEFLRDLHAIPVSEATAAGLGDPPPAPPADLWPERLAAIRETLYPYLWADQHAYVEDLFAPVLDDRLDMAAYRPAIIHNDLASYHILVDPDDGRLTGCSTSARRAGATRRPIWAYSSTPTASRLSAAWLPSIPNCPTCWNAPAFAPPTLNWSGR